MNLFYVKTHAAVMSFDPEMAALKTGLLFGRKVISVGFNFKFMKLINDFDKVTDKQIVDYCVKSYVFNGQQANADNMRSFFKLLTDVRNTRGKTKDGMAYLAKLEKQLQNHKKDVYEQVTKMYIDYKIDSLFPFFNDTTFEVINYIPEIETMKESIEDIIIRYLTTTDVYPYFDESMFNFNPEDESNPPDKPRVRFMNSQILFTVPDLSGFTGNQLMIIRNLFREKMNEIYPTIDQMRRDIEGYQYNQENQKTIKDMIYERPRLHEELFDTIAEENIYFQQLKNSKTDIIYRNLMISITSIKTLVHFYKRRNIIDELQEEYILNNIGRHKNIENCIVFFTNKIKSDDNAGTGIETKPEV
jgi:hypothetical protein